MRRADFSNLKTPMGPFQVMVLASDRAAWRKHCIYRGNECPLCSSDHMRSLSEISVKWARSRCLAAMTACMQALVRTVMQCSGCSASARGRMCMLQVHVRLTRESPVEVILAFMQAVSRLFLAIISVDTVYRHASFHCMSPSHSQPGVHSTYLVKDLPMHEHIRGTLS